MRLKMENILRPNPELMKEIQESDRQMELKNRRYNVQINKQNLQRRKEN
jgi:hypothetical protein